MDQSDKIRLYNHLKTKDKKVLETFDIATFAKHYGCAPSDVVNVLKVMKIKVKTETLSERVTKLEELINKK